MQSLNLHLALDDRPELISACAAELHARLPPGQWALLASLAAEIVARWETAATGSRVLLVPAQAQVERVARDLGLPAPPK